MRELTFNALFSTLLGCAYAATKSGDCQSGSLDFVIVGGGTAGLALATRLSQKLPDDCILVIEAGPDGRNDQRLYIPGLRGSPFGTSLDWFLPTIPQPAANNRTVNHNRGKVLGGTSALNLLVWDRASVAEYNAWEELGNPGWNWTTMYPAMLRAENFQRQPGPAQYGTDGVAYGGPIQSGLIENPPLHLQAGIPTLKSLGLAENLESLNGSNIGTMYQPAIQRFSNHTRSYAVDYLPRAGSNLVIKYNTTVSRVKLDGNCATGVILPDGTEIRATKEVVVSAGSLLSPKLLELSGIGQKSVLDCANITQLIDHPGVGENLQDHTRMQSTYELKPSILGLDILKYNSTRATIELDLYKRNQTSLYQYAGSAYGFMKWSQVLNDSSNLLSLAKQSANFSNPVDRKKLQLLSDFENGVPDIEIIFSDGYTGVKGYPANTNSGYGKQYATIFAGVMHPFARGSIHINTSDSAVKPTINPRYLSTPYDLEASIQAAKLTRKVANTAPYTDVWTKEYDPGMAVQTDAQWESYVRDNVWTFYHPMGTCAMLPREDGGVVDAELRVYGIERLRVVDASVIPMIISAHIQTAVYGIAERASDMIAEAWK